MFASTLEDSNLRTEPGSSQPKTQNTVLAMDEVRSDVLGVPDGSAIIGHEEIKTLAENTLLSHRNNVNSHSRFTSRSGTESNHTVHLKCCSDH